MTRSMLARSATLSSIPARFLAFAAVTGSLLACSSDDGSTSGSPPNVTAVTITPTSVAVGKAVTLTGEFQFEDPDGDLSQFSLTMKMGAQSTTTPKGAIQNVAGQKSGKGIFAASLVAPQAGDVEVALTLYDAGGNASAAFTTVVTAK